MSVLDRIRKLNRKTQKRLYILGYLCGPIALLFCLIVNERVNDIPAPNPVDIPTETALVAKASTFGRDFLILWLAGAAGPNDKALQARIDEISSIPGGITLPATSFSITEVKDLGPEKYTQEPDGDRNWIFEYDVIGTAPGDLAPQKRRYSVQFVQHGVSYRATRTPLPINATATPFRVETGYPENIDPTSTLGKAASDFADAYLRKGDNASLGRTVSGDFRGAPAQASPYENTETLAIYASDIPPAQPDPGTRIHVLASIKATISGNAFNTVTLPLEMLYTDQQQWVVNTLDTDARYGASTESPAGEKQPGR
ncbi:hypothetical protein ACNUDN_30450 [Mycobacterium sp. smrl_JER01]|uniref:hypothetical protein n=1 Tax=Mycobacterium sp. smrl_JER01 TaxID=3402633 RepID=UPI003AC9CB68